MTATASSTREDDLVCSILDLIEQKDIQKNNTDERQLHDGFIDAVGRCIDVFEGGDTPRDFQKLLLIVLRMKAAWQDFELHVSPTNWQPAQPFWTCVTELENELTFAPPVLDDGWECEPIALLVEQKLTPRQIGTVYSWEGQGPFIKNGQVVEALVRREMAQPGSVLGKDFVHPRIQAQKDAAAKYSNRLAKRADELRQNRPERSEYGTSAAPIGHESIEELILQNVPDKQICVIKACTLTEVLKVKAELTARMKGGGSQAEQADVEEQIAEFLATNPKATNAQVAKAVDCDIKAVAGVVRKLKELTPA